MGRILYGVMGDAQGHVSRSLAVAQSLPDHEFLFLGGGSVHTVTKLGYRVEDVPMAGTLYRGTQVDLVGTAKNALQVFARSSPVVRRVASIIRELDPDLIITDYEYFTPLAAKNLGRRCVSLDHQHVLTHCSYEVPREQLLNRFFTCSAVRYLYSNATRYFIISFFMPPPKNPDTVELFPPILRKAVFEHSATEGEHVVVYVRSNTFNNLLPLLSEKKSIFHIYGMEPRNAAKNIVFKPHSVHGFLEDIASCRYIIATGGHALISESLYFGKPLLCIPVGMAYEQFLNAHFVEKMGLGRCWTGKEPTHAVLDDFESHFIEYRDAIRRHARFDNRPLNSRLEQLISEGFSKKSQS
ncbi:glycosyltransferase family protein [Desulfomonile tiedjei]|uniref:Glycosyl transferase, UDP-glucuronosyltransferase n=1 Tax=Desulfomonile tiedjei (strain ATCC 49306 / DSM 6799 / DCB-1) TaxID=706587 RepID=I4C3S7_DESTA|nr:glycosyltransferase family protein [Desulfomonile tiedjei]AFM24218.1 glycosyl transferase, UDP-glucuronosyltransferase [Desulfomonile tiedjei DSM 6799]